MDRLKKPRSIGRFGFLIWMLLVPQPCFSRTQKPVEKPQLLRLEMSDTYLVFDAEKEREKHKLSSTNRTMSDNDLYEARLGLTLKGSVYHSLLLGFHIFTEVGDGSDRLTFDQADGNTLKRKDDRLSQRYNLGVDLLKEKPYGINLFAQRNRVDRDIDFFVRETVDINRFGGRIRHTSGILPFDLTYSHTREDVSGSRDSEREEGTIRLQTVHRRSPSDSSRLSYEYSDLHSQQQRRVIQDGGMHVVRLHDSRTFSDEKARSHSTFLFRDQNTSQPSKNLTFQQRFVFEHSSSFKSSYEYIFADRASGPASSENHQLRASIRHQLFRSLTSTAELEGYDSTDKGNGNATDMQRIGVTIRENYRKRLGSWGRFSANASVKQSYTDQQTQGMSFFVVDEPHILTDRQVTILSRAKVDSSTVVVTDDSGTIFYLEGLDYVVIDRNNFKEIQRVLGGDIPDGTTVLVDYTTDSQPSDTYRTLEDYLEVRVDIQGQALSLYGRIEDVDHEGANISSLQELSRRVAGIDTSWRWFRVGGEVEQVTSNHLPYRSFRLHENLSFSPLPQWVVSLNLAQRETTYSDSDETQRTYSYIARCRARLARQVSMRMEAGLLIEHRPGPNRELITAKTTLESQFGKLKTELGYELENEDLDEAFQKKHYFFVRLKRTI